MFADFNVLSWFFAAAVVFVVCLVVVKIRRARREKRRLAEEREWAEMLVSGDSDEGLLDTWIGESVVFLPEKEVLITDRAQNPILSPGADYNNREEFFISRSEKN